MLTEERKEYILQQVSSEDIVKSQDLIHALNVSESTIRRDLQELEEAGLIKRIHGGCKRINKLDFEPSMAEKASKNVQEKHSIAKYAASLINEGDVFYLDAGTTTFEMISFIQAKDVMAVTNSIFHANALADADIPVIILGGLIKNTTKAVTSNHACSQLSSLYLNKAFLGTNGIHPNFGYTTPDPDEAFIKNLAINQSQITYILADHAKFGETNFSKIANLNKATIITDFCPLDEKELITQHTKIKEVK